MTLPAPAFARDPATATYYDRRAAEYDEWYLGQGHFAVRDRPGWHAEVGRVVELVRRLPAACTLDVACGSGFLTRHLPGVVVRTGPEPRDGRPRPVTAAPRRRARWRRTLGLPFADRAFDRVLTGHFYGHLPDDEREVFLAEARRVARELVVVDSALRPGVEAEQWQERVLNDGSRHQVYKRFLGGEQLARELGGQLLLSGAWFVAARASWPPET